MGGTWTRSVCGAVIVVAVAAGAAGCGSDTGDKVSSAASQAADALASATDTAQKKLGEIKDGVDAKDAATLGEVTTDGDGRATVQVTTRNAADSTKSFAVQVNFRDGGGNLLDTVVVTVPDVAAGQSKEATARSTHALSGTVKGDIGTALRY